jgi:hypothetical protein
MASAGDNDPDGEVEALRERLDSGSVAFGDVILLKHWQTLEGDGSEAKRRFGEARYYQELERFQSSEGGNAVDVAVFGGAALGVYLTPDGTFKWTVIGRTIWFDWSEAYRLAYRVDAVAEKAREWWGSRDQVAPDSPGARQKTAAGRGRRRDSSASEVIASVAAGRLLEHLRRLLGRARVELDQQVDDDPVLVVLVEADVGEELARAVIAERRVGERVAGLGPRALSTSSASTVTVHEATHGVPAIIRSQRSSIGSTRPLWKPRCG